MKLLDIQLLTLDISLFAWYSDHALAVPAQFFSIHWHQSHFATEHNQGGKSKQKIQHTNMFRILNIVRCDEWCMSISTHESCSTCIYPFLDSSNFYPGQHNMAKPKNQSRCKVQTWISPHLCFANVVHNFMLTFTWSLWTREDHPEALPGWILLEPTHPPGKQDKDTSLWKVSLDMSRFVDFNFKKKRFSCDVLFHVCFTLVFFVGMWFQQLIINWSPGSFCKCKSANAP